MKLYQLYYYVRNSLFLLGENDITVEIILTIKFINLEKSIKNSFL